MNTTFRTMTQPRWRLDSLTATPLARTATIVALAFIYFLAARFGLFFASLEPHVSAIWPPAGVALAAIFLLGYEVWPGIFLGAFFANLSVGGGSPFVPFAIAAGNTLEGLLALYLVQRFMPDWRAMFDRTVHAVQFVFFAGLVSTAVAASIGTLAILAGGLAPVIEAPALWFTWLMGDAAGVLLIATPLIMWGTLRGLKPRGVAYFFGVFLFVGVAEKIAFGGWLPFFPDYFPIAFIALPPLIVGAFWVGRRWAMTAALALAILATLDTLGGSGPFAAYATNESLLLLQAFLGTVSVTTLVVSVLISERGAATKSLAYREEYFRSLIEKSFEGILVVDSAGAVRYASPSIERLTGYDVSSSRLVGASGFAKVHPEDLPRVRALFVDLSAHPGRAANFEVRFLHADGRWIWISAIAANLLDSPYVEGIVLNLRDVTREKESQKSRSYLASIVESADDAIIGRDLEGVIHSWNRGAERLYGYAAEEVIGKPLSIIVPSERRPGEFQEISERIRRGETIRHYETVRVRKDGTSISISFSASPMYGGSGEVIGASIIVRDLTEEKALERRKHEFISSVSYQLRTPVAEIGTYVDSLRKRKARFTSLEQQYLLKIENANLRMAMLLNNLLKVTRIELGTIPVEPRPTDLTREVDYVVREFAEKFGAKEISFERSYHRSRRLTLTLDPTLLTAALVNLFSHAIASVPPKGRVAVEIVRFENDIRVVIRESGNGAMAARAHHKTSLSAVAPLDPSLDFYVAKSLVERIGGTLDFERDAAGGMKFAIAFPLR